MMIRPSTLARVLGAGVSSSASSKLLGPGGEHLADVYRAAVRRPFRVVCADPPWPFGDSLPGAGRGAAKNYDLLSLDDIRQGNFIGGNMLRAPGIHQHPCVADDAYLFLWRVSAGASMRELTLAEEAYTVARAWGFAPKTELIWRKLTKNGKRHFGMGWHIRNEHEACIIAVRGKPKPLVRNIRSVFEAMAPSSTNGRAIHSAKPPEFYTKVVEKMSGGPYLELFGVERRHGWTVIGDKHR